LPKLFLFEFMFENKRFHYSEGGIFKQINHLYES